MKNRPLIQVMILVSVLGLSLACGLTGLLPFTPQTVITVAPDVPGELGEGWLDLEAEILQRRFDEGLAGKARVKVLPEGTIRIELAEAEDQNLAELLATEPGLLELFDSAEPYTIGAAIPEGAKVILTSEHFSQAELTRDNNGQLQVAFDLTEVGAQIMADHSGQNIGRFLVIARDGAVIFSPVINEAILEGVGVIVGDFDEAFMKTLVAEINSGPLVFPLKIIEVK
jgi:preprotein translocase subunit SecD